jgi:hypothetical protein
MVPMDAYVLMRCERLYLVQRSRGSDAGMTKIILGSIVTRCPSMSLAPSALVQLDSACELFAKAARGFRAGKVLVSPPDITHRYFCSRSNLNTEHHAKPATKGTLQPR